MWLGWEVSLVFFEERLRTEFVWSFSSVDSIQCAKKNFFS